MTFHENFNPLKLQIKENADYKNSVDTTMIGTSECMTG